MRDFASPPSTLVDAEGRASQGRFRGGLPRMSLEGLKGRSPFREKRWDYALIVHPELMVAAAIVDLKFASKAFAYVFERRTGRLVYERAWLGAPWATRFEDEGPGKRSGRFRSGDTELFLADRAIRISSGGLAVDVALHPVDVSALGAVAEVGPGRLCATEKRLALVQGEAKLAGQRFFLDGAYAGLDHSLGFAPRRTAWRWAFGLGKRDGAPFGVNLVEGFIGEAECAAWVRDTMVPLGEGVFEYDLAAPEKPWRIKTACGAFSASFLPGGIYADKTNLGVIKSHFLQPVGEFTGKLSSGGETFSFDALGGVVEHQDVLW